MEKQSDQKSQHNSLQAGRLATRKNDALTLAQLLYDIYKEEQVERRIEDGQNNAQQDSNTSFY